MSLTYWNYVCSSKTCEMAGRLAMVLLTAVLPIGLPARAAAQEAGPGTPLSLQQAVAMALEKNPQRRAAFAETKAAASDVRTARSFLLPQIAFSETATRGTDPVYVFGGKLRQQRFTAQDFAVNVLNTPEPFGNFSSRLSARWDLFDSLASWHSVRQAERMNDAAKRKLERAEQEVEFRVIESYYGALLAKKQREVAEQAMRTAQAILERSRNRYEAGVSVESDHLSAQVRLASRKQELIRAENNLGLALAQLGIALGHSTESGFAPADELSERNLPALNLEQAEGQAADGRPDLKGIRSAEAAQQQNVAMAKASFGPRINAFADWQADNPTFAAGGGGNNWLAGIELRIELFQGGARRAKLAHERAIEEKLGALRESAADAVRLEVRRAYYDMDAARRQVEVARLAIDEAKESLRINQNRYEAGLQTISDLLAAEEAAHRAQTEYWETLCRYYTSYAAVELAGGTLGPDSPVVKP